jgi:hypothetical protein
LGLLYTLRGKRSRPSCSLQSTMATCWEFEPAYAAQTKVTQQCEVGRFLHLWADPAIESKAHISAGRRGAARSGVQGGQCLGDQERGQLLCSNGAAEQIALTDEAAHFLKLYFMLFGFDTFGDDPDCKFPA